MTAGRALFVLLLAVELGLVWLARSRRPAVSAGARRAVFALPIALALALRAHQAFTTADVLDWDETYYLSNAVTAARGHGLYPYIFGYDPMPVVGGVGYAAYVNALAVLVFGPSLMALRALSLAAAIAGLAGIWSLVRRWYGSGAAWAATALTSTSSLFMLTNTARMDSWAFAYVAWSLVLFAKAYGRWEARWPHLASGLVFALGLQVHPDIIVTALAAGIVYSGAWALDAISSGRVRAPLPPLLFLAGWCMGFAVFLAANVLPDPAAFYKTALAVRVDATDWYSQGTTSLLASFTDPRILLAKEAVRYRLLASVVGWPEVLLFGMAIAALAIRRSGHDRLLLGLVPAIVAATAVMLNNAAPLYFVHVLPALLVPLGPLFSHGFRGGGPVALEQLGSGRLLAFALVISLLAASGQARLVRRIGAAAPEDGAARAVAERVRAVADTRCKIAGDGTLYVRYFTDYPYFISTRPTEVSYAMIYFDAATEADYWARKRPDVVFASGPLPAALQTYVSANGFVERAPGVWGRRDGCLGGP